MKTQELIDKLEQHKSNISTGDRYFVGYIKGVEDSIKILENTIPEEL